MTQKQRALELLEKLIASLAKPTSLLSHSSHGGIFFTVKGSSSVAFQATAEGGAPLART
jgi:hypothetical protein